MTNFLDQSGLEYFWGKSKDHFPHQTISNNEIDAMFAIEIWVDVGILSEPGSDTIVYYLCEVGSYDLAQGEIPVIPEETPSLISRYPEIHFSQSNPKYLKINFYGSNFESDNPTIIQFVLDPENVDVSGEYVIPPRPDFLTAHILDLVFYRYPEGPSFIDDDLSVSIMHTADIPLIKRIPYSEFVSAEPLTVNNIDNVDYILCKFVSAENFIENHSYDSPTPVIEVIDIVMKEA